MKEPTVLIVEPGDSEPQRWQGPAGGRGYGTMMFTIVGILLMVDAAGVLYAVSNKKSA